MPPDYLLSVFQIPNNATEVRLTCLPLKDHLTSTPPLTISKAELLKRAKIVRMGVQLTELLRSMEETACAQISISSNDARVLGMLGLVQ